MRYLGIDSNYHGIGYAVIERGKLIDWGIKYAPKRNALSNRETFAKERQEKRFQIVEKLIEFLKPDAIVLEDWTAKDCLRAPFVKKLFYRIDKLAAKRSIKSRSVSRMALYSEFAEFDVKTKYDLAVFLSEFFPELKPRLPEKRKAWMSENVWLSMFKAVALCFVQNEKTP
jgi:hypothetical protein